MPSVNCTSCGRAISVPEHLRGTWVMCPGCYTSVEVLGDPAPRGPADPTPNASPPPTPEGLVFGDSPARRRAAAAPARALQGAASWLMLAVAFDGLCAFASCILGAANADSPQAIVGILLVAGLVELAPLALVAWGALHLMTRGSLRLAQTGAVVAPFVSCWFLFRAGRIGLEGRELLEGSGIVAGLLLGLALFTLVGACCGAVGGVRTLMALADPSVRRLFDRARRP